MRLKEYLSIKENTMLSIKINKSLKEDYIVQSLLTYNLMHSRSTEDIMLLKDHIIQFKEYIMQSNISYLSIKEKINFFCKKKGLPKQSLIFAVRNNQIRLYSLIFRLGKMLLHKLSTINNRTPNKKDYYAK